MAERLALHTPGADDSDPRALLDEQLPQRDYDPAAAKRRRGLMLKIGAGAAAFVAAGGLWLGLRGGDVEEPRQPQVVPSAGLAPGEGAAAPTPSASEQGTPTPEASLDMNQWTPETFKYNIEGETLTGVAELEMKYGITVEDNPTGANAAKALMENVNRWINSIDTKTDNEYYAKYSPLTNGGDQLARNAGVANDLAAAAWAEVLTSYETTPGGGTTVDPEAWIRAMQGLHVQNIQDAASERDNEGPDAYKDGHYAGFKIKGLDVHAEYQGETGFTLEMTFTPTNRPPEHIIAHVTMKQVDDSAGRKVWKVISWQDEAVK